MSTPEQIGRHRILEPLGSGGFATVWRGYDAELDADVAVKILAENWVSRADIRARFVDEARLLRRADSDRVVRVHDIGTLDDGRPYFVMSYADGGTLADRLTGRRALPVPEALRFAEESARAVGVLHDLGILHRDVKPSNILFRSRVDGEQVMIADLGLAKAVANASGVTVAAGTPGYMPPEQTDSSGGLDERVDVYALGALTYQMLTGALPTSSGSATRDPVPPSRLRSGLPPGTDAAVLRALSTDREHRWPDAGAFAAALHDLVAGADRMPSTVTDAAAAPRSPRPAPANPPTAPPPTPAPAARTPVPTPVPVRAPYSHPPSPFVAQPTASRRPARRPPWNLKRRLVTTGAILTSLLVALGGCVAGIEIWGHQHTTLRTSDREISIRVPNYWTSPVSAPATRKTSLTRFGGTGEGLQLGPDDNTDPDDLSDHEGVTVVAGRGLPRTSAAKLLDRGAPVKGWLPAACQASGVDQPSGNATLPGTVRIWTNGGCAASAWYGEAVLHGSGFTVLVYMKSQPDDPGGKSAFGDAIASLRVDGKSLPR